MPFVTQNLKNGVDVSVSTRKTKTQLISNHIHNYNEIYYLCRGEARFFVEGGIINISAGDVIFIRKGTIHKTVYTSGQYTKRLLVCFDDEFAGEEYKSITDDIGAKKYISLPPIKSIETEKLMQKMYNEYNEKQAHYLKMCACMTGELLITLSRQKEADSAKTLNENDVIMQAAAKYITCNFADNLSLSGLSQKFAMSPSHFSKTFKSSTGFGVSEYITAVRLANAEKMLMNKKISITEVASKCGFNDSNYFSSVFKKKNGITPLKFSLLNR